MRDLKTIKAEQDQAIYEYGAYLMKAEEMKAKVFRLAQEAIALNAQSLVPMATDPEGEPLEPEPHLG